MSAGDAQPTVPIPEWAPEPAPAVKRRRPSAWPWIVVIVIVGGLAVAAWLAAEWIARGVVENTIRDQIVTKLALPADHPVEVEVAGIVIPQLIVGTLDDVIVASDDVPLGPVVGDVEVHAEGIAIRGEPVADSAAATIRLDEAQLQALMATVEGFPADSLALAEPDVTITTELSFLGLTFPIGVALTPSAADGDLVLTPATLRLGDADITADELSDRFGILADGVLKDWSVCIAQYIPTGVVLTDVGVHGETLVASLDVDGRIAADPALQAEGSCA